MSRHHLRFVIWLWTALIATAGWSQNLSTLVRVVDQTGVEGIAGVVLLFNSSDSPHSFALITDAEGRVTSPHLSCIICTVTALDPQGLFYDKTSEFDGRSTSVTLTLKLRPIIDSVGDPRAKKVRIKIYGPNGSPLPNQSVIVRPILMAFDANWAYRETTDSTGLISAELLPGEYVVATPDGDNSLEASIEITKTMDIMGTVAAHLTAVGAVTR